VSEKDEERKANLGEVFRISFLNPRIRLSVAAKRVSTREEGKDELAQKVEGVRIKGN